MSKLERYLVWGIRLGCIALLSTPLVVTSNTFFPYIVGKNIFFRLFAGLIVAFWVALMFISPRWRPRLSAVTGALGVFLGVITVTSLTGVDPYHSFWSSFERMEGLITHFHMFALVCAVGSVIRQDYEWMVGALFSIGVSAIVAFHGFLQAQGIIEIPTAARPYATLGNSIYLAVYLMAHIFLLALVVWHVRSREAKILLGLVALLEWYVFFVGANRGAFIGLLSGIVVATISVMLVSPARRIRQSTFGVLAGIGLLALLLIFAPQSSIVRSNEIFARIADSISLSNLQNDPRVMIWGIAFDAFRARPLLGWGPENFVVPYARFYNPALFGNEPWFDRTHNMVLEWLVAAGLFGALAYIALFISVAYMLVCMVKKRTLHIYEASVIGGFFTAYFIQNLFVFDTVISYIFLAFTLAFLHAKFLDVPAVSKRQTHLTESMSWRVGAWIVLGLFCIAWMNIPIWRSSIALGAAVSVDAHAAPEVFNMRIGQVIESGRFASSEARERFADTVLNAALQKDRQAITSQWIALVRDAAQELEYESALHAENIKYPLFASKLYTVLYQWTRDEKDKDKANTLLDRVFVLAPLYVQSSINRAELALVDGDTSRAIISIDHIFAKAPRSADLFYTALLVHIFGNDVDGALRILEEHTHANQFEKLPVHFQSDRIAEIAERSRIISDGKARVRLLIALAEWSAPTPILYREVAQTLWTIGERESARVYAERALKLDPSLGQAFTGFFEDN